MRHQPVLMTRRGGRYEAVGFVLILAGGVLILYTAHPLGGLILGGIGFVVFLIGRFL
jgi:hypothetical protein